MLKRGVRQILKNLQKLRLRKQNELANSVDPDEMAHKYKYTDGF